MTMNIFSYGKFELPQLRIEKKNSVAVSDTIETQQSQHSRHTDVIQY